MADYTLPVVFHIIHQNGPENISDAAVLTAFNNLNDAFANTNFYGGSDGVDTKIQFCLAKRDPNGNPTTGINRVVSPLTNASFATDIQLKNLIRWNPQEYINIWLVSSIEGGGIAGYAYLPFSHGGPEDGIVMLGSIMPTLGGGHSTLVHEMGHYLGLYHTFEGGCVNSDCALDGDLVCDTPPDGTTAPPGDCSAIINSCTTDSQSGFPTDQNDLNWNYVDYGNQPCRNGYTQGQADRMAFFIENVRQSLLNSPACQDPCLSPIAANFSASAMTVNIGGMVNFTNTTTGGTSFVWSVNGTPFATTSNASYTFNSLGSFEVMLAATNGDPNCSSKKTLTIEVVCPVTASFSTSNLYPAPGETVNFTNNSTGANSYTWSVNGTVSGSSANFSNNFTSPGQYNVCLEAGSGLCEQQFCQLVFVFAAPASGDCESSFIRRIGDQGVNEESFYLIPDGAGNFFLAGMTGNKSLITQLDPSGNILNQRTYDFTSGNDFISCLMVDDQGFLVGSARDQLNSNTTNVQFKINWQTGNVIWAKKVDNPAYNRFDRVFEHPTNGNYMFCGMTTGAIDNYIIQLDKTNGNVVWQFGSDYGDNGDVYSGFATTSNAIYYAGQGRLGGGLDDIRPTLTKFDLNGNMQWARIHLRSPSQASRLYNLDIFIQNDTIINCGRGSLVSDDLTTSQLLFYKTNINGILIWAKSYTINGGSTVAGYRAHPIPDGYIVQGSYLDGSTTRFFVARLNKLGNVIWAKRLKIAASGSGLTKPLTGLAGGFIYFAAQTTQYDSGQNNDLLFGKISLDGQDVSANCPLIEDITLVEHSIVNAYDGSQLPTNFAPSYVYQNSTHSPIAANLPLNEIPGCECTEFSVDTCANGLPIHTTPDALLQNITAQCNGDSMLVSFEVCNTDSVTLPQGTPISFYQNNPTATAASLLATMQVASAVPPGACEQFTLSVPLPTNQQIFAVMNDNGTIPPPFDLAADFPNTPTQECDFTNNMASFTVSYSPPVLNLGPDLATCDFDVTALDAGPGFASYHWYDGSTEQTLTAWQPGTYSVSVTDQCGGTQTDAITLSVIPSTILEIGMDTLPVCEGDSAMLSVSGFSSYQWFPAGLVDCPTCPSVTVTNPVDTCLIVVASDGNGCYSADTVCLHLLSSNTSFDTLQFCQGDTVIIFGNPVTTPGDYSATFSNQSGCDSTVQITLVSANDTIQINGNATICAGETYPFFGATLTMSGTYEHYDGTGACVVQNILELTVLDTFFTQESMTICNGDSAMIFGVPTNLPGTYSMVFASQYGCDSTHSVLLEVLDSVLTSQTIVICENETANIFGTPMNVPGVYSQVFPLPNGCDSTVVVNLMVNDTFLVNQSIEICQGDSVLVFGNWEAQSGVFTQIFPTSNGCDSTVFIQLTVSPSFQTNEAISICEGQTANVFGTPTSTAGTYSMTFTSQNGCDSIHTITLTVIDSVLTTETIVICENETANIFGNPTNVPGMYQQSYPLPGGCDSTHVIDLIVNDSFLLTQNLSICAGDSALVFGNWEKQAGIYSQTLTTQAGCDSTLVVVLDVGQSFQLNLETQIACPFANDGVVTAVPTGGAPPYTFEWTNSTISSNQLASLDVGTYSVTVTDANGCAVIGSVELEAAQRPEVSTETQDASCFGVNDGSITIMAADPTLKFIVQGAPASPQTFYQNLWPGGDQYFVVDTFGCSWVQFYLIDSPDKIVLNLPNSIEAEMCDSVQIKAESPNSPLTYSWTPTDDLSCTDCPDPIASPFTNTTYFLTVQDSNGCSATDSTHVLVNFEGKAYIPNAFSPNNDGINDVFYVLSRCVTEVRIIRVFDRWGELVFEKSNTPPNDPLYGWNGKFRGKDMNADVFVYHVVVVLADGSLQEYKGDVTLLR